MEKYCDLPLANVNGKNPLDYFISVLGGVPEPKPMYLALKTNNVETVKVLVNHGADLYYQAPFDDYYYLDIAISWGETDIIDLLVEKGAPLKSGYLALSNLLGNVESTELWNTLSAIRNTLSQNNMLDSTEYELLLQGVALHARTDILNRLLEENATLVNYQFSDGKSLLDYALMSGYTATKVKKVFIEFLLLHNYDKSMIDAQGKTAYDYAIEYGYGDIAEMLRER